MTRSKRLCSIDGCGKRVNARGWCGMHYMRWRMHGDVNVCTTNRYISMEDRFWMKVQKTDDCWNWTGSGRGGYGTFTERSKGRTHLAHRMSYELLVDPIPDGMRIDHRCRNTLCVNPEHLRPVTHKQNMEHRDGANSNNISGVLGVHWIESLGKYRVIVNHNKKPHWGGQYVDLNAAAAAAQSLRNKLFTHNDQDRIAS